MQAVAQDRPGPGQCKWWQGVDCGPCFTPQYRYMQLAQNSWDSKVPGGGQADAVPWETGQAIILGCCEHQKACRRQGLVGSRHT
jgi:hypothetical protein